MTEEIRQNEMKAETFNLLFVGVGGQGVLLAAELTALAAARWGADVKQTEVHGVSQRGGTVETHVRFGAAVHSPIVTPGQAHALIALEKLEALRFAHFVHKQDGTVLVNDYEVVPGSVAGAAEHYPYNALDYARQKGFQLRALSATEIAADLGNVRMANVVLLGALSKVLPLPDDIWRQTLETRIPEKFREANLKAFAAGRDH